MAGSQIGPAALPTFGPDGELFFYSATRSGPGSAPEQATIHYAASPTAQVEVVAVAPAIMLPNRVLADGRLVVDYASGSDNMVWNLALLSQAGEMQLIEGYTDAKLADVLR